MFHVAILFSVVLTLLGTIEVSASPLTPDTLLARDNAQTTPDGRPMRDIAAVIALQPPAVNSGGMSSGPSARWDPSGVFFLDAKKGEIFGDKGGCKIAILYQNIAERFETYQKEIKNEDYPWRGWADGPNGVSAWCPDEKLEDDDLAFQIRSFEDKTALYVILGDFTPDTSGEYGKPEEQDTVVVGEIKSYCDAADQADIDKCEELVSVMIGPPMFLRTGAIVTNPLKKGNDAVSVTWQNWASVSTKGYFSFWPRFVREGIPWKPEEIVLP